MYGYGNKKDRTIWELLQSSGNLVHFKQPGHSSYVGLCGGTPSCGSEAGGGSNHAYGYSIAEDRTKFEIVKGAGNIVYLKQPSHSAYLGMCGGDGTDCDSYKTKVYGYSSKVDRTKFEIIQA
jgi:putative component of toxin-antitoxin plasmid stabilization module